MSYGQYSNSPKPDKPALPAKTKRIKTVFGPHDTGVEHVWAHPLQKDGSGYAQTFATNPQRNFYFKTHEDNTRVLYSYRDTYPIGARLSAPGYLDCTEWSVFDTEQEAEEYLDENYPEDEEDGEDEEETEKEA